MRRNPVTPLGHRQIEEDLKRHKSVLRPTIVLAIEEARALGDLKENAEYHSAKEQQALIEARIVYLEQAVAAAEIIDIQKIPHNGRAVFGTTVVLENVETGVERRWRIVGQDEADVSKGDISYTSPVAKAVIGKDEGMEAQVPAPGGPQVWEIVEVLYI